MTPPVPKRVALYLRVSTTKGQTTDNQRMELEQVAANRGWPVVAVYEDIGISGAKGRDKRPQFDQLHRDATSGKFDIVAAWAIDRVGRSVIHVCEFMRELDALNVGLYLHQQQIDTTTPAGRALVQMAAVFAEFERSMIRERINAGLARARRHGTKSGNAIGRPAVADHVRTAVLKGRERGHSIRAIASELQISTATVQKVIHS
jgi:DNA invertase Pin-like site-specific DNA recombinase